MHRRDVLRAGGAAIFALSVPGWARVFAQRAPVIGPAGEGKVNVLGDAIARARKRGLPLLVLRAPSDAVERERLGKMWGAYLSLAAAYRIPGSRTQCLRLADLAMCEIVCAVDEDIARELRVVDAAPGWRSGIALVVEPLGDHVRIVPGPMIHVAWSQPDRQGSQQQLLLELSTRLRLALAADLVMLEDRARQNLARMTRSQHEVLARIHESLPSDIWRDPAADAPACLRLLVETSPVLSAQALTALARSTAIRLEQPIAGSRWERWWSAEAVKGLGCVQGPCGTGHAPEPSVRFLRYYTSSEPDARPHRDAAK